MVRSAYCSCRRPSYTYVVTHNYLSLQFQVSNSSSDLYKLQHIGGAHACIQCIHMYTYNYKKLGAFIKY